MRPPFDPVRAAFFLVALVFCSHIVVVLAVVAVCLIHVDDIVSGRWKCDADGHLYELLGSMLSAALAFAGGMMRGGPPPPPRE
jgi:hypothetical protein